MRIRRPLQWMLAASALLLRPPTGDHLGWIAAAEAGVVLGKAVVCRDIERRQPVGLTDVLKVEDGRVYLWLNLKNNEGPNVVRLHWLHAGKRVKRTELKVATSDGYRTWAYRNLEPGDGGRWRVEIENSVGVILGAVEFRVLEGAAARDHGGIYESAAAEAAANAQQARIEARAQAEAEAQARARKLNNYEDLAMTEAARQAADPSGQMHERPRAEGSGPVTPGRVVGRAAAASNGPDALAAGTPGDDPADTPEGDSVANQAADAELLRIAQAAARAAGARLEVDPDADPEEVPPIPRNPNFASVWDADPEDEGEVEPEPEPEPEAEPEPEPEPVDARAVVVPETPRGGCRALVNLRHNDGTYAVLDVRPGGGHHFVEQAPGLATLDPAGVAHALRVVSHADRPVGPHGVVDRRWDELWGIALPSGTPVKWAGQPARVEPASEPTDAPLHEHNRLRVISVLGPLVGLDLTLRGHAGEGEGFDHSRYLTVRPPGRSVDVSSLFGVKLAAYTALRAHQLRPDELPDAPNADTHDYRQVALRPSAGGVEAITRLPCCTFAENGGLLEVVVPLGEAPEALAGLLPDERGHWADPQACGAIWLDANGVLQAQAGRSAARPLPVAGAPISQVLGVFFIDGGHPFAASAQRTAWGVLGDKGR